MKSLVVLLIAISFVSPAAALPAPPVTFFDNIELLQPSGEDIRETSVRIVFEEKSMRMLSRSKGTVIKEWSYDEIKSAEYSYSKNPRWKTGLGLGAAGIVFPPLLLIAIPLGFTKHRRHWITIRTDDDYAVLKVGKGIRKIFMPAFETRTSVPIKGVGENK